MGNFTSSIASSQPQMGQPNQNSQGKGSSSPQQSQPANNAPQPLQQPQVQPTPQASFSPPQNTFNSMMGVNQWDNHSSSSPSSGKGGSGTGGKSGSGGSVGSGKGQSSTSAYQVPTVDQNAIPQLPQYQAPVQQAQQATPVAAQIPVSANPEWGGNMSSHGGGGGG